jgi:hypothetical protein
MGQETLRPLERLGEIIAKFQLYAISGIACILRGVIMHDRPQAFDVVTVIEVVTSIPDRV